MNHAEYDRIGVSYTRTRQPDPRIARRILELLALPPGSAILDVGAGTGNYSRALSLDGYRLLALEPSAVMRSQATEMPGVRWIAASAEEIPLPGNSVDGAFVMLAWHHFPHQQQALGEILRVIGPGPLVIFSWDAGMLPAFWLCDYFPGLIPGPKDEAGDVIRAAENIAKWSGRSCEIEPFPLPLDLADNFAAANWARPEAYLRPEIRAGISSFASLPPALFEQGLANLEADLRSGRWDERHGHLRTQPEYDTGYRFLKATRNP